MGQNLNPMMCINNSSDDDLVSDLDLSSRECSNCGESVIGTAIFCLACKRFQGPPCKMCGEALPGAHTRVCNNCKLHQRILPRWFTALGVSSLISTLPLLVVFYAYLKSVVIVESNLEIIALQCSADLIETFVKNTGNRPAVITADATYTVFSNTQSYDIGKLSSSKILLLGEGEGQLVKWIPEPIDNIPGQINMPVEDCALSVTLNTVEFGGEQTEESFQCACRH